MLLIILNNLSLSLPRSLFLVLAALRACVSARTHTQYRGLWSRISEREIFVNIIKTFKLTVNFENENEINNLIETQVSFPKNDLIAAAAIRLIFIFFFRKLISVHDSWATSISVYIEVVWVWPFSKVKFWVAQRCEKKRKEKQNPRRSKTN